MKHIRVIRPMVPLALLATLPALGQSSSSQGTASSPDLDASPAKSPNRFSLNYRMGFNAPVSFKKLGGFPALSLARYTPDPDHDRYNYDDGYVLTDSSGSKELTWYWGYDNASQVSGNTSMDLHRSSSDATVNSKDHWDEPMSGFELTYARELIQKKAWRGGLEGAFGYTCMSVHDGAPLSATVTRLTDTYTFPEGVVVPPDTGYHQGKQGPGTLIDGYPSSSSTTLIEQGATITGHRDFSADLFGFRLGPYIEVPLGRSVAFTLSGGFAAMYVDSDFSFAETVAISGIGSVQHSGEGAARQWLAGGYITGNLSVALSERWALAAGAQFIDAGHYTQTVNGKEATLDLSRLVFVTLGLTYSF